MDGILNVLKPPGMTSFDVVAHLRGLLGIRKIGHAGTLDPAAAGVLPICLGRATRAIEYMSSSSKTYRAEMLLGVNTDTQDTTGIVTSSAKAVFPEGKIIEAVAGFKGKYMQVPPMYSAVKSGGVRLYKLARQGVTVERSPREVEIFSINVLCVKHGQDAGMYFKAASGGRESGSFGVLPKGALFTAVMFDVTCSSGTYVRTLCEDIGKRLGCGGCMSFLLRLRSGIFEIGSALTIEEIRELSENSRLEEMIAGIGGIFEGLKKVILDGRDLKRLLNGAYITPVPGDSEAGRLVGIYDGIGNFAAVGEFVNKAGNTYLKLKKSF